MQVFTFNIAASTSVSQAATVESLLPVGVYMPTLWDAADLAFSVSVNGTNFEPLYDQNGQEVVVKVAAGKATVINPGDYAGFPYIKLRSGSGDGIIQTADRVIKIAFRGN